MPQVSSLDLAIHTDSHTLGARLCKKPKGIQMNDFTAGKYGLRGWSTLRMGEEWSAAGGMIDYHQAHGNEGVLVMEDYASFCALLCMVDPPGNVVMLHTPLDCDEENTRRLAPFAEQLLRQFRKRADAILTEPRTLLVSGLHTEAAPEIISLIQKVFDDVELLLQVSLNPTSNNVLQETIPDELYRGTLFIPQQISASSNNTILLLNQGIWHTSFAQQLRSIVANA